MKKVLSAALVAIMLLSGIFVFSGCGDKKEEKAGYNKEVNQYVVETNDKKGELSLEIAKDLNYETGSNVATTFRITSKDNMSEISFHMSYDYKTSATITKKEKDFYSEKYHDYAEVTAGDYKGWSIYYGESQYDMGLVLTEPDANNKVYGVTISVRKSPVMKEGMTFDVKEFVNSEDFKHMLDSLKFTVKTEEQTNEQAEQQ
ncbi:MAG: hypothetical protein IKE91_03775 [Clostridia bacterium]|nr:hypothetical protein [Clostridia bacterium]